VNYLGSISGAAYFYAQGVGGNLGVYQKSMAAKSMVTIDYTGVTGMPNPPNVGGSVTITSVSFVLGTQTLPELTIYNASLAGQLNILTFMVSGGFGGVQYQLSVNVTLSNGGVRTDVLAVNVIPPYEDGCGCASCGHAPCSCYECDPCNVPTEQQVATLVPVNSIFGTNYVQYYVSATAPQNPNLFDKWYNMTNNTVYEYVSNGMKNYWQPGASSSGGTFTGPVTIDNSLTVTGPVDLTLDMGYYP
jgi:hypothetical protein